MYQSLYQPKSRSYRQVKEQDVGFSLSYVITNGQMINDIISERRRDEREGKGKIKSRFARVLLGIKKMRKNPRGRSNKPKKDHKWYAYDSGTGRELGGPYDSRAEAYNNHKGYKARVDYFQRKTNPDSESEDLQEVEQMTSSFHGREPKEVEDYVETIEYEDRLAILADLLELQILTSTGKHIRTISFETDRPRLTCDAKGENLQLVGGDQSLPLKGEHAKDLITVGYCVSIAYETDKHHLEDSNGRVEAYEHYFGEDWYKEHGYSDNHFFERALEDGVVHEASERGRLPLVVYDCRNERILFVGGKYKVEDVGIRD